MNLACIAGSGAPDGTHAPFFLPRMRASRGNLWLRSRWGPPVTHRVRAHAPRKTLPAIPPPFPDFEPKSPGTHPHAVRAPGPLARPCSRVLTIAAAAAASPAPGSLPAKRRRCQQPGRKRRGGAGQPRAGGAPSASCDRDPGKPKAAHDSDPGPWGASCRAAGARFRGTPQPGCLRGY